jgi:glycosyltransferase involved in cell wall biosynthesis
MQLAILIPAFDAAAGIADVVAGARRYSSQVVVVDDGSSDATAERARQAGAAVLSHATNRGKGVALLTGMRWLHEHGVEHVLTMDADRQHLAEQIPVLLAVAEQNPRSIVIGDRRLEQLTEVTTPLKRFGNRFANRWVEIACGMRIPDTQSGFRVYPVAATLQLGVRAERFAFETEVLIRAARAGIAIESVPIEVYYPRPEERVSHFRPFADTVRIIFVVVGLILGLW